MTRGRKPGLQPGVLEADSVEDAVRKLEALKKRETGARPDAPPASSPAPSPPEPSPPKKRGRPPKAGAHAPERASFGVSQLTAHRPLGLLEVQHKADLDALLADPRLAPQITLRLDDRFALVLPAQLERLQAALLKAGHTPRLSSHAAGDRHTGEHVTGSRGTGDRVTGDRNTNDRGTGGGRP